MAEIKDLRIMEEALVEASRRNSAIFTQYVFGYVNAPYHNMWHSWMDQNSQGLILAYRGSGKSEQMTGRILWEIGNNPNIRIKIATESIELGRATLSKISSTILTSERFKKVFPEIKPDPYGEWSSTKIRILRKNPVRDATIDVGGVLTAKTGSRADLLILDDVVGMRNALLQPKFRPVVIDTVMSNWFPMLDGPTARWFCIGTPWHIEDLVSLFRNNPDVPKAPEVKVGPNFESPWPEKHSPDYFKEILKRNGRVSFNRGYRLIPISSDETWINKDLLYSLRDFETPIYDIRNNIEFPKYTGVDLGHRSGKQNCPTVIFTIALLPSGKRVPVDIKISYDASPLNISRVIIDTCQELKPSIVLVENVGAQQYLIDILKTLGPGDINIEGYFTSVNSKMDLRDGVPGLLAEIESQKWLLPFGDGGEHDVLCTCSRCRWLNELADFPNGSTDTVMASWLALQGMKKLKGDNGLGNFSVWEWGN